MDSVVVAVDGVACSDIEEVAPKLSCHLESMSHQSIIAQAVIVNAEKEPTSDGEKIDSLPLHIAGDHIKNSRKKLLDSPDDDETAASTDNDGDEEADHNIGCDNQSFSKSESVTSVKIDVNNANPNIFDDVSSIASSSVRKSFTQTKDPDDKKQL